MPPARVPQCAAHRPLARGPLVLVMLVEEARRAPPVAIVGRGLPLGRDIPAPLAGRPAFPRVHEAR